MFFDTSVLVDHFRGNVPTATGYVDTVRHGLITAYCSTITEVELLAGTRNRAERTAVESLLSYFTSVPLSSAIAKQAGELLRSMNRDQTRAHFADALIAASAIDTGEVLLTGDRRSQRVFGSRTNYLVYRR